MADKLQYESGFDRAEHVRARRGVFWKRFAIVASVALILVMILAGFGFYVMTHEGTAHVRLVFTNNTTDPVTNLGIDDAFNSRAITFGSVAPGHTETFSTEYNENLCPEGLSFNEAERTLYVPMGRFDGQEAYTMVLTPNQVAVSGRDSRGATTQSTQMPTTQPLVYLDQNGKPLPVWH